ncbi:hypothetical protein AB838_06085 [Rhodobacteraceae bacterium (ex Bugula neritina AB1)]|nr:hypothetical protein AB838_06085 [Rhodobacteraceae bacterium (ex Bugula neritina AB1)]
MPAENFSLEMREDGGAWLALSYKHAGRSGIQRISCDLQHADLVQLVLFAEALSLRKRFGHPVSARVSTQGLEISYDPAQRDLHVVRQAGYSKQSACIPVAAFDAEMAGITDICFARAEGSKHGPALKRLLAECAAPAELLERLAEDEADLAMHQLREIALLLLTQEADTRSSALARKLRAKKSQEQAREAVVRFLLALAAEFFPISAEPEQVSHGHCG